MPDEWPTCSSTASATALLDQALSVHSRRERRKPVK
jgi:hypothetical protein